MPICTIEQITESKSQAAKTVESLAIADKSFNPAIPQCAKGQLTFRKSIFNSATSKRKIEDNRLANGQKKDKARKIPHKKPPLCKGCG